MDVFFQPQKVDRGLRVDSSQEQKTRSADDGGVRRRGCAVDVWRVVCVRVVRSDQIPRDLGSMAHFIPKDYMACRSSEIDEIRT